MQMLTRRPANNTTINCLWKERSPTVSQDTPSDRHLIGKYIEVLQFPGGHIEIRVAAESPPHSPYDKLGMIDQGAIVDKRSSHVLRALQAVRHRAIIEWYSDHPLRTKLTAL